MSQKPVAAGKSSVDHVDLDITLKSIMAGEKSVYLDLACGVGRYSLALAERLDKGSVIHALDLWDEGIAALRANGDEMGFDNIRPRVADATRPLPLEDRTIDVCFMATALHDLPVSTRPGVVRDIRRVLVSNGVFVLIEFKKLDYGPGPHREKRIGERDADALIPQEGFKKDMTMSLGEFTYLTRYYKV